MGVEGRPTNLLDEQSTLSTEPAAAKIDRYERFVNERLKVDLNRKIEQRSMTCTTILQ